MEKYSHLSDTQVVRDKPSLGLFVKTFGCQMNEYDSENIKDILAGEFLPIETPEEADLIIVNTCSVRDKAEQKLYSVLGRYRKLKDLRPNLIIGVAGCVAQQEGQRIFKKNSDVNFVVGTHNISLVPELVRRARAGLKHQTAIDYRDEWEELSGAFVGENRGEKEEAGLVRALVAVQRGCSKRCSFCVVPMTRGAQLSRSLKEIQRELRLKVAQGAKEVLLLGQTVNSYGADLRPRVRFEDLIMEIAKIPGVERIRFTSPHPAEVRESFVSLYKNVPALCPHIHLPLQSGSDRILGLMRRSYASGRYLDIVDSLRKVRPDIAITSDIIVGFPTETEEDFEMTLEIMRNVRYHSVFSFKYSPRPNTVAAERFSGCDVISAEVSQSRLAKLQALQDEISREINTALIGSTVEVLVEGPNKNISSGVRGRIPQNTHMELVECAAFPGETVCAVVEHAGPHGLRGSPCVDRRVGVND